jgi:diguanylate cyclase (GGDEF)-like protein/PAS domain S-box-containing protein
MQQLKEPELRYRRLFDTAQDGILMLDAKTGVIEDVNPYLIELLGYPREEFLEKKLWEVGPFRDIEASQAAFETLAQSEYTRYEGLRLKAKNGKLFQVEFQSNVYPVDNEKVIQCNIRDITACKQAQETLLKNTLSMSLLPVRDPLTGLFNRNYMEETLRRELLRASRTKITISIIMMDVDDFQKFNYIWGRAAGDVLLDGLSNLMFEHFRGDDIPSRYGGDEFAIVMPGASRLVAYKRAKLVCEYAKHLQLKFEGQILDPVTFSIGVASFPEHGSASAEVLRAANDALDSAKHERRGRV